jgi:hypothetical protein
LRKQLTNVMVQPLRRTNQIAEGEAARVAFGRLFLLGGWDRAALRVACSPAIQISSFASGIGRYCPKEIVMTKNLSCAGMIALMVAASPALAVGSASRTFVSGIGSDTGTCPLATPCRTFAYALTQTAPSGEIIVLSSAGYGTVTINQAVSIINTSNFAGVTVGSGNGITINAGSNDSVTLRGLTVDGSGTGSNGIVFNTGGKLTVDQCDLMNFVGGTATTGNGILMQPTSGSHTIAITNTTASNNGYTGVNFGPPSGSSATTGIVIDRVSTNNNQHGILINNNNSSGAATATISNSIASFNTINGFAFANVTASLDASNASSNVGISATGVFVGAAATLALGRSVLMNNSQYGLQISTGTVNSYKDNRIAGNGSAQVSGTPATATLF